MNNFIQQIIGNYFKEVGDKILEGKCELSEEQQLMLFKEIAHTPLNKTEASELLGMSTRQFDRKISEGVYPEGKKIRGQNTLIWYRDELYGEGQ